MTSTSTAVQGRSGPLLLLDGMSLAFRAYYALPDTLATTSGVVTNAVHGFTSMLVYLIREQHPSALAVAFDAPGATFRDEILEDYKAGRAETPWLLPPQFDMIREVMEALAIPVVEAPGFAADDVLATLATEAVERQTEVVIVTGDRDSFQLVQDPYVRVLYNKRGVSDYALYDEAGIFERTGVPPTQYVLLASLRGDPSDNLPGIPGVGEKTAAKLLTKYGDLDGIFAHLDDLSPKLRQAVLLMKERVAAGTGWRFRLFSASRPMQGVFCIRRSVQTPMFSLGVMKGTGYSISCTMNDDPKHLEMIGGVGFAHRILHSGVGHPERA